MLFLGIAFIAAWVLIAAYLTYMGQRQRHLEQEFQSLAEMVEGKSRN